MLKRLTQQEIRNVFGDPGPFLRADGTVGREWERHILTTITLPGPLPLSFNPAQFAHTTKVHRLVARQLSLALEAIYNDPEAWRTINDWGGCYCFRANRRNPKALSTHCWALGPDMDVGDNPQGSAPNTDPHVRAIMEAHGFLWGGTFHGAAVDGMHYEFADLEKLG